MMRQTFQVTVPRIACCPSPHPGGCRVCAACHLGIWAAKLGKQEGFELTWRNEGDGSDNEPRTIVLKVPVEHKHIGTEFVSKVQAHVAKCKEERG